MPAYKLAALSAIVLYGLSAAAQSTRDVNGKLAGTLSEGITVLLFTRTDCPISNRYAPEVARLYHRFHSAGVRFRLVYVDPKQSLEAARAHSREYGYPFEAVMDDGHAMVKLAGVRVTPEAAVYASGRLVYRGRIDNRYVSAGKSRLQATVHDLEDTLSKLVDRHAVTFRSEPAIGCYIEDLR